MTARIGSARSVLSWANRRDIPIADQALLGAVVKVSFQPAALRVHGFDQACPGGLCLDQCLPQSDPRAGELEREVCAAQRFPQ